MKYENEELIDDGTCPVPYVPGTPPRKKLTEDNLYHISGLVEILSRATYDVWSEEVHTVIDAIQNLETELRAEKDLANEFIRQTITKLERQAIDDNICPSCGTKLEERVISESSQTLEYWGQRCTETSYEICKHCYECGWDEED